VFMTACGWATRVNLALFKAQPDQSQQEDRPPGGRCHSTGGWWMKRRNRVAADNYTRGRARRWQMKRATTTATAFEARPEFAAHAHRQPDMVASVPGRLGCGLDHGQGRAGVGLLSLSDGKLDATEGATDLNGQMEENVTTDDQEVWWVISQSRSIQIRVPSNRT